MSNNDYRDLSEMKFKFKRHKYGKELLIDCDQMTKLNGFTLSTRPFWNDFHEIFIITSGSGTFKLNDERIAFSAGTVLLLPPNKWRQWETIHGTLDGYVLIFEEEFISKFFNDGLFLYRFHYFYNNASPSYIQLNEEACAEYIKHFISIRKELQDLQNDSSHLLRAILYLSLIHI